MNAPEPDVPPVDTLGSFGSLVVVPITIARPELFSVNRVVRVPTGSAWGRHPWTVVGPKGWKHALMGSSTTSMAAEARKQWGCGLVNVPLVPLP